MISLPPDFALLRSIPVLAALLDRDGCFIEVSDAWVSRTGHTQEALRGRRPEDVATPDSARRIREEHLPRFRRTGRLDNVPVEFLTSEGATLELLATTAGEYDERGVLLHSLSVFTERNCAEIRLTEAYADITRLKEELELERERHNLREAVADIPATLRELKNVIERAVNPSTGDTRRRKLSRPEAQIPLPKIVGQAQPLADSAANRTFLTEAAMREQQRANVLAALEAASWRISGKGGAAELLGIRPTTLADRMRALRISRPARTIA